MSRAIALLDAFYAKSLGCAPADLRSGRVTVVERDLTSVRYAKGSPLAVYALATAEGAVAAVRPGLASEVRRALAGATTLDDAVCASIERAVAPLIPAGSWFRGVRLFCEPGSFVAYPTGDIREIAPEDEERLGLPRRRWSAAVFGAFHEGGVVSRAGVKQISDVVWDLSIDTLSEYRGRGYAKAAVTQAAKYVFANGRLAGWGCDVGNAASLRTAAAVGFQHYAYDFGCIVRV